MNSLGVRLFVALHVLAVLLIYCAAIYFGGHPVGEPFPAPNAGPAPLAKVQGRLATPSREPVTTTEPINGRGTGIEARMLDLTPARPVEVDAPWALRP